MQTIPWFRSMTQPRTTIRRDGESSEEERLSGSSASGIFISAAPGPEGRVSTSRRMSAKKKSHDAMFFVNTPSPAAACSSPADSATGCSRTNRASLVSRRIHRLLRVPPTGSSASGAGGEIGECDIVGAAANAAAPSGAQKDHAGFGSASICRSISSALAQPER
jgi:hypothetical protein